MKWLRLLSVLFFAGIIIIFSPACKKENNNSPYPQITLMGQYPDSITASKNTDTLHIYFNFWDGNGDLGTPQNQSYIVAIDSRNANDSMSFIFPDISPSVVSPTKGLEGNGTVNIPSIFIRLREDSLHKNYGDTLQYTIYVTDNSGKQSNRVTTSRVLIRP
jgi:cbb3-type cytochrome oxidase subunit 3